MDLFKIDFLHNRMDGNFQRELSGACPHCSCFVRFEKYQAVADMATVEYDIQKCKVHYIHSMRRCPHCLNNVFLVSEVMVINSKHSQPTITKIFPYPAPRFNRDGLPELLQELLDECLSCFQLGLYRSAGVMLRRCLEQICEEQGISGGTLHKSLELLRSQVQIDNRLYDILFDLKALGNDAAHVTLSSFDKVGYEEVGLGLEIFMKVVDSLYQTEDLLQRFKNLKKQP